MSSEFKTEHHTIGYAHPIYFIAEIGLNHNGNLSLAKQMVDAAADAGASAAKFQLFHTPSFIHPESRFGDGPGENLQDFFRKFEFSASEWRQLADYTRSRNMDFLCSVFDIPSLELYLTLQPSIIKIASADIDNRILLDAVRDTGLPAMLSTGTADETELMRALSWLGPEKPPILLLCVSSYPARVSDYSLGVLNCWGSLVDVVIGISDHTLDNRLAVASIALNACIVEKHFTIDRTLPGPDQALSITPEELKELVNSLQEVRQACRRKKKESVESESNVRKFGRRSLYMATDRPAGSVLAWSDLIPMRPGGSGVPASDAIGVIGKKLKKDLHIHQLLEYHFIHEGEAEL